MSTISRIGALYCVLLLGCTESGAETIGQFQVALEAQTPSGTIYRLRGAVFDLRPVDGAVPQTVTSEDDPMAREIIVGLEPGDYTINLLPGWFLEREVRGQMPEILDAAQLVSRARQSFSIRPRQTTFVTFSFLADGAPIVIGDPGLLTIGIEVIEGDAGLPPPPVDGGDGGPPGRDVRSGVLESNPQALQAFTLREVLDRMGRNEGLTPNAERIYGSIIDSYASAANGRLRDVIHCGDERTNGRPSLNGYPIQCDRLEALQFDNLDRWFPIALVNRLDFAPVDGSHCGQQRIIFANNEPIGNGRMFMILEAQVPNPSPECGPAACRPIAEAWEAAANTADPIARSRLFRQMFLDGSPELQVQGFGPFVTASAYTIGSGQIRTNNFDDFVWTLREFKLAISDTNQLGVVPFPVAESPNGQLWNDRTTLPQGAACRANFLESIAGLLTDNTAAMGFVIDQACKDAESVNDGSQDYPSALSQGSGGFANQLAARLVGTGLTPRDLAARARFSGSCIGCHLEGNGVDLGRGVVAPFSLGFVHVDENFTEPCGNRETCFAISDALRSSFLPHRRSVMDGLLNSTCGGPIDTDGGVGPMEPIDSGVDSGAPQVDAGIILPPRVDAGPTRRPLDAGIIIPPPRVDAGPTRRPVDAGIVILGPRVDAGTRVITPILAPLDTPVPLLVEQDVALRSDVTTLGGRPAGVTH